MKRPIRQAGTDEDWRKGGFGLYVHWPFCQTKCPYCDFNSHVSNVVDQSAWSNAFVTQIEAWAERLPNRLLGSIFFGGGTPSLMEPKIVGEIISAAQRVWQFSNDIEITLEANPSSVEAARFTGYVAAGVNRVSLGVQALDDGALRRLGRKHSSGDALLALDTARSLFGRTSFDLIYGRQDQTLEEWRSELTRALSLSPTHLSLYQLTIEDGTVFGERNKAGKLKGLPEETLSADMFELTQELCSVAGLPAYEVSNHAAEGEESRHNLVYWRYGDFVGLGPGAHGRVTASGNRLATLAPKIPSAWLKWSEDRLRLFDAEEVLSPADQATEYLLMSLRLSEGTDLARFAALRGDPLDSAPVAALCNQGLLWQDGDRIGTTPAGRPLLNAILRELD